MRISELIKQLNKKINSSSSISVKKQNEILQGLPEPIDDFDRAYYQYYCQKKAINRWYLIRIRDFISILFLLLYRFLVKLKTREVNCVDNTYERIFVYEGNNREILPTSLADGTKIIKIGHSFCADSDIHRIMKELTKRYPTSFYFQLKIFVKLVNYCYMLNSYSPSQIICSCEYSFTSSILTLYCEMKGIKHINVMHGEKIYDIRDAFCRFSEFYVWDEHYIKLFDKLRANSSRFIIETPPSLVIDMSKKSTQDIAGYKFYLDIENKDRLVKINKAIIKIMAMGYSVKVRPHPIYTNIKLLHKYIDKSLIEDPAQVPISDSLASSDYVVARFSTVLYQAYSNNIKTIIDDYSDVKRYNLLLNEDYIMLEKTNLRLSEIIRED
jgi:hypothetical protein